jgi:hypothetical protein
VPHCALHPGDRLEGVGNLHRLRHMQPLPVGVGRRGKWGQSTFVVL